MNTPDIKNSREDDSENAIITKALRDLGEYFDTVQLFVSRYDSDVGATASKVAGSGNIYARMGQVGHWLDSTTVSALGEGGPDA